MSIRTQVLQLTQDDQGLISFLEQSLEQLNESKSQNSQVKRARKVLVSALSLRLGDDIGAKKQSLKQYVTLKFIKLALHHPDDDLSFTLTSADCGLDLKQLDARIDLYNQLAKLDGSAQIDTVAETLNREELEVTPVDDGLTINLKH